MARQPLEGNRMKFQLKLIEMLGKGFKEKEHHDFVSDVEQSRAAYKIGEGEVEYFVMRALLSLPVLATTNNFLNTLQEILNFYQSTLLKLMTAFIPKLECLRAIEEANLECDHLKIRESSAFLVHHLVEAGVLDGDTVLQFYRQLQERNSYLAAQQSFRMMITWLHDEAAKKRQEQKKTPIQKPEDEDKPLSHWVMKDIEHTFNVRSVCLCSLGAPGNTHNKYSPLFIWVTKKVEDTDADGQSNEGIPDDDAHNEMQDVNQEQLYGEEEQSDIDDQDEDEDEYLNGDMDDVPDQHITVEQWKGEDRQ